MKIAKPAMQLPFLVAATLTSSAYAQPILLEPDVAFKVKIEQRD